MPIHVTSGRAGGPRRRLGLSLGFSITTVSIVYFGVQKGIERIARVFLPILFGILVLLLVSALRMDGAGEAIGFIFRPSFRELDGGSVLEALGHSFFTLSLGMGAMVTYGSYLAKNQSIVRGGLQLAGFWGCSGSSDSAAMKRRG